MTELTFQFPDDTPDVTALLSDLRNLINEARERAAIAVNRELTLMHWHIGDHIRRDILREERADYGEQIVSTVSRHLEREFGRGFGSRNVRYMMQFAEMFPEVQIVQSLIAQLSWTHILQLLPMKDRLKREF